MRSFFRTLLSLSVVHWVTGVGVVLTTASAAVFLAFVFQRFDNPYIGIIVFLIIPAFFTLGLILMPLGVVLAARRAGGYSQLMAQLPAPSWDVSAGQSRLQRLRTPRFSLPRLIMAWPSWTRHDSAAKPAIP